MPRKGFTVALAALVLAASPLAVVTTPAEAQTVYCTNCASQWTQVLQQAQQAQQLTNQISQLSVQVQQYQQMMQDGLKLPDAIFGDVVRDIGKINQLIEQGKGLAYTAANLDEQFKQRYGDLDSYTKSGMSQQQMQAKYRQWSEESNSAVLTTFRALGSQASSMQDEQALLNQLQRRAGSAQGQMQAIAVGNELAAEGISQMQKLRQLLMVQAQFQAQTLQIENDRAAAGDALMRDYFQGTTPQFQGQTY